MVLCLIVHLEQKAGDFQYTHPQSAEGLCAYDKTKALFSIFSLFLESIESNARYHNRFKAGGNVAIIGLPSINWGSKIDLQKYKDVNPLIKQFLVYENVMFKSITYSGSCIYDELGNILNISQF